MTSNLDRNAAAARAWNALTDDQRKEAIGYPTAANPAPQLTAAQVRNAARGMVYAYSWEADEDDAREANDY